MIQQAISKSKQPVAGISIAMLKGSSIVWQEAFGVSSVPGRITATMQTRFNIGSVSKLLAALAATVLVDRGLITLRYADRQVLADVQHDHRKARAGGKRVALIESGPPDNHPFIHIPVTFFKVHDTHQRAASECGFDGMGI
jgi:CubicO group peptidase (beta-lactamase class C family)